ncbi:flagellar component of cell-proximal portion of basal-body rod [Candidatus Propionivibrio aalborgensis]|uniref:Flagellar basal-body rod protein FlgF n=1 Tax=Candidatus Propionivibrio aalborgensis TaxID=1860101 RepID=A0A1A8XSQ2_9RHOO|nr:flagellar basal-body rod protein FlgF [Candidatus Propionivibrio aalborgensis]SBT08115.1 flagellar component of cell-proximal portion of basal-body rod [Candidatus Propionivibrio aalborgensis]
MDRLIYTAMTGAKHAFLQQAGVSQNLSNASTVGYRAMEHKFRAVPVQGDGAPTRAFVVDASVADVFEQGPLMATGRPLDVAVQGAGWITVETPDGREVYTRAGNLQVNTNGQLQTATGLNVLGDNGPIAIPPDNSITIAPDGTISTVPLFGAPNNVSVVGRIKLVNPAENDLVRGDDGLFRTRVGEPAVLDENVKLAPETLEGSNVNAADSLVNMITLARQFDMQIKMLQTADANANKASQILSMNA